MHPTSRDVRNASRPEPPSWGELLFPPVKAAGAWTALVALGALAAHLMFDQGGEAFVGHGILSILLAWFAIPPGAAIVGIRAFVRGARRLPDEGPTRWIAAGMAALAGAVTVAAFGVALASLLAAAF